VPSNREKSRHDILVLGASNGGVEAESPQIGAGESQIRVSLPPGTPPEAETAVRRLVELTGILARRCAQLQHALQSRIVIEQAKGVLAERYAIDADDAFEALRRTARSKRIKLHDLAADVVAARTTPALLDEQFHWSVTSVASAPREGRIQVHPRS
jgi:hypothetical protein